MLQTNRLTIRPLEEAGIETLIDRFRPIDPELATTYGEMLEGCRAHPDQRRWYTVWEATLSDSGVRVGDACFKGLKQGITEIGYGIDKGFEGQGYATELVMALCQWAMAQPGVLTITAETLPDNLASQRVLEKAGFLPTGQVGKEGPLFERKNQRPPTPNEQRLLSADL